MAIQFSTAQKDGQLVMFFEGDDMTPATLDELDLIYKAIQGSRGQKATMVDSNKMAAVFVLPE